MSNQDTSFKPKKVYDHFIKITEKPHPSANQPDVEKRKEGERNEDNVRIYVNEQAKRIGVDVVFYNAESKSPGERVIILSRRGSGKYSEKSPVILQAHMDMVVNPVNMAFPIKVIIDDSKKGDGKWLKAKDSSLGADDGIGIATILAILEDEALKDYPLECLFTVQEETNMGGAQNCDLTKLKGNQLLNLDAEILCTIIYGSAGGSETEYKGDITHPKLGKPPKVADKDAYFDPDNYVVEKISISGLSGGHSGVEINKGKLNAIKVLTQVLIRLNKRITNLDTNGNGMSSYDFLLYDMKRTDVDKANAIPAAAEAVIALPKADIAKFEADFKAYCEALKTKMSEKDKEKFNYEVGVPNCIIEKLVMDKKSTDTLLCILQQIPHGVIRMLPDNPNVVETSTNLCKVAVGNGEVTIGSSNRSSNNTHLQSIEMEQKSIGICFDFMVYTDINSYPPWQPNRDSKLLKLAGDVFESKEVFEKCEKDVIHAGLECGVLVKRFKNEMGRDLDAISIGPTITEPHGPNESLQVEDADGNHIIQKFYDAVSKILQAIFD